jgi:putative FmdB family regulatory protein
MPMYEYRCRIGHFFEMLQSMNAANPDCRCGAPSTRLISNVAQMRTPPPNTGTRDLPRTWLGTHSADREYLTRVRREHEARSIAAIDHPGPPDVGRRVVAHEGRYSVDHLYASNENPTPGAHSHTNESEGEHP